MSPVDIDPLTGAPVVKPITELPPVTESSHVPETSSETLETSTEEVPEELAPNLPKREATIVKVEDILKRYTSDSQSTAKALAEIIEVLE